MNLREDKNKIITFFIVYILFDIIVVGSFVVTSHEVAQVADSFERMNLFLSKWPSQLVNPFSTIFNIFKYGVFSNFISASVYTLIASVLMFIYWKIKNSKNSEYQGQELGSADWAKYGEEFRKLPGGKEVLNRKEGFILSKKHYLGTDFKNVVINKNILVFGGSGTGKSACFVKPNIMQMLGSYVITDPKGELYRGTSQFLKANGYNVKVLNFENADYSDRYNPLAHIRDYTDVDIIADTIVMSGKKDNNAASSDPFWDNASMMLLKACIYYVISVLPEEQQNLSSCLNIIRAGGSDETILDRLFEELKPEHPGRKEYDGIRLGADKTKQSIAISLASKIGIFDAPNIQKITTSDNMDFEALGQEKTAIYVISSDSHSTYDYILTVFYAQLLQRLYAEADKRGGELAQPVYMLLDEFANIGTIPDFSKKVSTTRSRGISISIILQSIDQLKDLYQDKAEIIVSNCDTQIFLGSKSITTCEHIVKSLGQKTIKFQSKSINKDKEGGKKQGVSYSEQRQGRDLMTVDELMRLPNDDEILLVRTLRPIRAKKAWYFKYHPQRENIRQYELQHVEDIAVGSKVPIETMDVFKHLEEREKLAKEHLAESQKVIKPKAQQVQENSNIQAQPQNMASQIENVDNVENIANKKDDQEQQNFDLQKQLEKKFDELFGDTNNEYEN